MQYIVAAFAGLAAVASALPQHSPPYPIRTGAPYPTGTGAPYPTGGYPAPTGTAPSAPYPTGGASCPVDGALVCNGPSQFGLCNFGHVVWQPVALGTQCKDGTITFADGYIPAGWPGWSIAPQPSASS